jgi:type I restriction enzyme, R subunit
MTASGTPLFLEDHISQVPALQLLQNLGWSYLTPEEALELRGGRAARVILTGVLAPKLRELNRIRFKGEEWPFSEGNITTAIQALEDIPIAGLVRTSERVYDLLRLGKALQQTISGDTRSFPLSYIDWERPERNACHVTEEFEVERTGSNDSCRPDLVLFINGIPIAVIECKRPDLDDPMKEAISQQIRNQKSEYIPRLFLYPQLLLVVSKNDSRYGTTGTPEPFWSAWREELDEAAVREAVNRPLSPEQKDRLFANRFHYVRRHFEGLEASGREPTTQDRTLFALCRPARLLELARRFVLYDGGEKKIARYQQYFCVKRTMERIARPAADGCRPGGVVWHTQGSGKSLTMVMLATAIAEDIPSTSKKVVLVTDRVDLDDQIWNTFRRCGLEPERARTGKHLVELLGSDKHPVITTVIDKFETAVATRGLRLESPDIFVLVDEGHRGQYGAPHAGMRRVLPHASFLGFTGTPVMKQDKDTIRRFGGLIDTYTIRQAVQDKSVVPLLYEGRYVPQTVDKEQIDRWFERITATLTKEQVADLKRKFSSTAQLDKAEQRVATIAWDASAHFANAWKGSGFKGQLVASDKATALLYKKHMDECGLATAEVLISAPDDREGDVDVLEDNVQEVVKFWRKMMERFGTEIEYNKQLINGFKHGPEPEIIIVVDKLLTGFDAPRNVVLYLTRPLKDHTLLQAIARVNRVFEGKDFGYVIDYAGVLQNLEHALDLYGGLPDFAAEDLDGTLTDVAAEVAKLSQRHSDLWAVFTAVKNRQDQEEYEQVLAEQALRAEFYDRLSAYARTLQIALATVAFLEGTSEDRVQKYKGDLRFFIALRGSVRRRYAEVVDFGEYEPRIQRLLDRHVGTGEVERLTDLVNIFDREAFAKEVEKLGSPAAQADTIAYRTRKTISEHMAEDPAYYKRFSDLLEETIAAFRVRRLSDAEYLKRVRELSASVRDRTGDSVPEQVRYDPDARALFGVVRETLVPYGKDGVDVESVGAETALDIERIIEERRTVNWTRNADVQNQMRNAIEDRLFELKEQGLALSLEDIDVVMERSLQVAKVRKP